MNRVEKRADEINQRMEARAIYYPLQTRYITNEKNLEIFFSCFLFFWFRFLYIQHKFTAI